MSIQVLNKKEINEEYEDIIKGAQSHVIIYMMSVFQSLKNSLMRHCLLKSQWQNKIHFQTQKSHHQTQNQTQNQTQKPHYQPQTQILI